MTELAGGAANDLRLGTLEVRLARDLAEIEAAQGLRYRVFYDEMKAQPTPEMAAMRRDVDDFDQYCDHLLMIDHARPAHDAVIGTYRLIRREAAQKFGRFYTSGEYDISCLISYPGEILELGRSCIAADYRTRPTMQLMWSGLAAYVYQNDIAVMFGCASFPGTNPQDHAQALSYLYYQHLAPPGMRPRALPEYYVDMRLMPPEAFNPDNFLDTIKVDPRAGGNNLPPLIKGYLRVGAHVGDGAFIDHQFNTTDVCIIMKTDLMADRYAKHYGLRTRGAAETA